MCTVSEHYTQNQKNSTSEARQCPGVSPLRRQGGGLSRRSTWRRSGGLRAQAATGKTR